MLPEPAAPVPSQVVAPTGTDDAGSPTVEQLRSALIGVMQGQRRHLEACAARHGLSGQLAISLLQLRTPWPGIGPVDGDADGQGPDVGMPMRELAGRISCDPSQVTGIADRLEDLGLVERRPSPQDRRVKLLVATEAGERVSDQLAVEVNRDAPGFAALDANERARLLELLQKVADASDG